MTGMGENWRRAVQRTTLVVSPFPSIFARPVAKGRKCGQLSVRHE